MTKYLISKFPLQDQQRTFWRPSIGQKIGGIFFLVLFVAVANIAVVKEMLHDLNGVAATLNVAGKLRMLSQKIAFEAVYPGKNVGNDTVKNGIHDFDMSLSALKHGGVAFGYDIKKLALQHQSQVHKVDVDWTNYRSRLEAALISPAPASVSPTTTTPFEPLATASARLLSSTEMLISSIVTETQQTQERALVRIYVLVLLDVFVLAAAFAAIRRQVVRPLYELSRYCTELASGNYHVRSNFQSSDEIGQLAMAFNDSAQRIGNLIAHIEQDRTSLRQAEAMFRELAESSAVGVYIAQDESFLFVNAKMAEIFGYESAKMVTSVGVFDSVVEDERQLVNDGIRRRLNGEIDEVHYERQARKKDGSLIDIEVFGSKMRIDGKNATIGIMLDITERKQTQEKMHLAASVFAHAREGIMITAPDGKIVDVNDAFVRITGYSRDEVLGHNPRILNSGLQKKEFYISIWNDLIAKGYWHGEIWNRRKNGELYAGMQTISAVRDTKGNMRQYIALFSDITPFKEYEKQLKHLAHYDALTNLPNRVLLGDRLHQAMAQVQRRGQQLTVAYLDLDGFKTVNDHHGHAIGDQFLMAVATHMKQSLREGDTLARLGGDEFVAVLLDLESIETSALILTRLLAAAAKPIHIGDIVLQVSASVGVTLYPQAGNTDVDADQLLRQADHAMYQAKLAGKNRCHVFDTEQDLSVRGHNESLEHIRHALSNSEFVLHYQPKVNMRTGAVIGAEALIRWQHPQRGLLPPAVFLPAIENHPLGVELGEWVIDTALTQVAFWHTVGLIIPVSVNVGAHQLQQANFVERLQEILAAHPNFSPGDLELEVLETSALEDLANVSRVIAACREMGVSFSLDDFGTGYSSLTYLKRLPVAILKIDQSFVRGMLNDPDDLAILEGVIGLATAFRRQVIAEGVETVEHAELLLQLGCELAQGYGIARPMPAHELPGWSAVWQPDPAWSDLPPVSRHDFPLLFAGIEHRALVLATENYIMGEREVPPSLDHRECRLDAWLDADGLAHYDAQLALQSIASLHQRVYALAAELCGLHAMGHSQQALARLSELHGLRDALLEQLKASIQEKSRTGNAYSRISGRFSSQFLPEDRILEQQHDEENARNDTRRFKAKVALSALKSDKALTEIAQQYDVHPNQITEWEWQFLERATAVFDGGADIGKDEGAQDLRVLYAKIGQVALENYSKTGLPSARKS